MRNLKLILEYDGTGYSGWQSQSHGRTIQDVVGKAVGTMTREKAILHGASRTDAGVHACGQVATFKTESPIPCESFLKGLNSLLPEDIRVKHVEEVAENFHPIRCASGKIYEYRFDLASSPSALQRNRLCWVGPGLDWKEMRRASAFLIGEHDFKSFQAADASVQSTVRTLFEIQFVDSAIRFTGNGFLKQMIRNLVGTLIEVGEGNRSADSMPQLLVAGDRRLAGPCAPAHGLYLMRVDYIVTPLAPPGPGR